MNVLKDIVNRVKKRNDTKRMYRNWMSHLYQVHQQKCYEENGNKDGTCYGLVGGDKDTEYVQYGCINCEYWRYYENGR